MNIPIPRGEARTKLVENGMMAKMTFESTWNENQMNAEIYSLFRELFENDSSPMFTFQYLRFVHVNYAVLWNFVAQYKLNHLLDFLSQVC